MALQGPHIGCMQYPFLLIYRTFPLISDASIINMEIPLSQTILHPPTNEVPDIFLPHLLLRKHFY